MGAPADNGVPRELPGALPWLETGPWAQRLIGLWLWRNADADGWVTVMPGQLAKYLNYTAGLFPYMEAGALRKQIADSLRRLTEDGTVDRGPQVTRGLLLHVNEYSGLPGSTQAPIVTPVADPGTPPYDEIVAAWNVLAETSPLLHCRTLTPKRKLHLRTRWENPEFRQHWAAAFESWAASEWVRKWKGGRDFNWIVKNDENWVKAWEGKYDEDPEPAPREVRNFDP